jgi:hypothetical protein
MYIVMRAHTKHNPVSYENLIAGKCGTVKWKNTKNFTVTKKVPTNTVNYNKKLIDKGVLALRQVTKQFESEGLCPDSMYKHYQIPKKTGGMRNIDEPNEELKGWQNEIVRILKEYFGVMHHTNAYGYVEKRCCLDVAEKHRLAGSNWFLKIDISDFFGSTTLDHLVKQLSQVYPFANLIDSWHWYYEEIFRKALKICFLNGGLPQGSPASPLLTNLLMIPFDYEITKKLTAKGLVYTRYSDDMQISGRQEFDWQEVVNIVRETFKELGAPYVIKDKKTHYGNINGRNWMLGVKINKDRNITVGWENHKTFKARMYRFIMDYDRLSYEERAKFIGLANYYKAVEPDFVKKTFEHYRYDKEETRLILINNAQPFNTLYKVVW